MNLVKPSFFIIGAAKAGSTSMAQELSKHPSVFVPPKKELHFFNYREISPQSVSHYETFFNTDKPAMISGESSPQYSFGSTFPYCASRIARYCPSAKIIYIVRDPIVRMQSHILQIRNWGGAYNETVDKIVEKYPQVVEASMYGSRIKDYLRYFKKEQLMVIQFEKLLADGSEWLRRVCLFLGVDSAANTDFSKKNSSINHFEDRSIMRFLRQLGLGKVGSRIPPSLKKKFINLFKKRQTEIPSLSVHAAACLKKIFREDADILFMNWEIDESLWRFEPNHGSMNTSSAEKPDYEGKINLS